MGMIEIMEVREKRARRLIEAALVTAAAVYYCTLAVMHMVTPIWDVLPLLLFLFTLPLVAALATVHFTEHLRGLVVPLSLELLVMALPFLIVMHNFLDGLAGYAPEFLIQPEFHGLLRHALLLGAVYGGIHTIIAAIVLVGAVGYLIIRKGRSK